MIPRRDSKWTRVRATDRATRSVRSIHPLSTSMPKPQPKPKPQPQPQPKPTYRGFFFPLFPLPPPRPAGPPPIGSRSSIGTAIAPESVTVARMGLA